MVELQKLFNIEYGNSLDLNKLTQNSKSVNFISRTAKNNGVSAIVNDVIGIKKMPKGSITVSLGGSVLEAFLQCDEYYTGYHIYCLTPKKGVEMSDEIKLFYCACIRANKYRYSYGRQANRTLKGLLVPEIKDVPNWVSKVDLSIYEGIDKAKTNHQVKLPKFNNTVEIEELFTISNGIAVTGLKEKEKTFNGSIMYVRPASTQARTLRSYIDKATIAEDKIFPEGSLFVSTNGEGSHSYSYVSTCEFVPNSDVSVLIPKNEMSIEEKLFYAQCITANRYLFSYGRKPKGKKLKSITVPKLNSKESKIIINYINSLPYSQNI
tara:strand:- start:4072 stop:5037 length:966 start_codon:yes stop_codon:yes gene_type:complete